jgi:hypothetical protein
MIARSECQDRRAATVAAQRVIANSLSARSSYRAHFDAIDRELVKHSAVKDLLCWATCVSSQDFELTIQRLSAFGDCVDCQAAAPFLA